MCLHTYRYAFTGGYVCRGWKRIFTNIDYTRGIACDFLVVNQLPMVVEAQGTYAISSLVTTMLFFGWSATARNHLSYLERGFTSGSSPEVTINRIDSEAGHVRAG